jgi:hypothetical protein
VSLLAFTEILNGLICPTAEDDYVLNDPTNETKFNFKLSEALDRAKSAGRPFVKKIFYVTPKVPIDMKLLKNVVIACGGQVSNILLPIHGQLS